MNGIQPKEAAARRAARLALVLATVCAGGLVLLFAYHRWGVGIPCPLHRLTGLYCPGCGTFRALDALAGLQWRQAFAYNALLVALLPLLLVFGASEGTHYILGKTPRYRRLDKPAAAVLIVVWGLFGLLRNLPWFAFLQPHML